jgi:4-carboxymuconolactone decarboxylase
MNGKTGSPATDKKWQAGLKVAHQVYGADVSEPMKTRYDSPLVYENVAHQFADTWGDKTVSIRDKRLLVLGLTAMLGRTDLVRTQINGALLNKEFTEEQLAEIPRFLLSYVGVGRAGAVFTGIQQAIADAKKKAKAKA